MKPTNKTDIDKEWAYRQLDNLFLPAVGECLRTGLVVVLVGASASGKSLLAQKALPNAKLVSGLSGEVVESAGIIDSDMIGEELHGVNRPSDVIRWRDQALTSGKKCIFTAQRWDDIVPHLAGLQPHQYKVFDLDRIWEVAGRAYPVPNLIPNEVLAN